MSRAYLRLDPAFDERKADYPDGPYAALIATFCLGESQSIRGRFRSLQYLRALLGKRGKHVRYLLDKGDLEVQDAGRVYIVGWDEWQEGNWQVAERMARVRDRRRGGVTPAVTPAVTPPDVTHCLDSVSGAMSGAISGGGAVDRADIDAFLEVRRRMPTTGQRRIMDDYVATFDATGPGRAAALIYRRPDDPIGALVADLKAFREQRANEAVAAESRPRPIRPLTGATAELAAKLRQEYRHDIDRGASQ